ncbi:hypothetical protein A2526_02015 [candidate division WOR-1 bacterium RIFOXYD2_FULL_36_8]|uniref:DNA polymerase III subunit gamma/tau n=1 Tax=candidate division WOR-1 bacterium RIFOXYB2_FULL_36_35 TaxID=1802578 RepID=A0A1F4S141_UNCSA|nr:MAG: hypothetical protein A2230_03420 [candidate division WOR-1 bacterium RIFOXYA2_FULL_36_21]OGC14148.1 MAG: hypothetical protein A2290_00530 [candidate division WOR-1 bacterium RIFOXYB2_FULL_36_35]OGC38638.1 MAG: hypothetical protein A2526_02015 [candidate division WOR-1 bacterium RIFOXYD2_FULL_36_8]
MIKYQNLLANTGIFNMTYISLYRKWRSQNFDEIVGQKHIVQTLKNAILQKRIAHAYLFCGPRGTGKTSIARIFAKSLNCREGITVSPCGKCDSCAKIRDGHSVDVIEIDAASNRGIDEIRDLREKVRYMPVEGQYKVYIIDEVHMLTTEAFNALLKTLEEPPQHVIFVLATTEASRVPATIKSRCQRLDFSRISLEEVKNHLKNIALSENFDIEDKAIDIIARLGEGSMRDSVSLLDQLAAYAGNKITLDDVVLLLGCADEEMLFSLADAIAKKDAAGLLNVISLGIDHGRSSLQMLRDLVMHFRNILFLKFKADEVLELTNDHLEKLKKQSDLFSLGDVNRIIKILAKTELDMKWHPYPRLVFEVGLLDVLQADDLNLKEVVSKSHPPKSLVVKEESSVNINDSEVVGNSTFNKLKANWPVILDKVKKKSLYGFVSLHEGQPVDVTSNNELIISFKKGYSFHKDRLEETRNKEVVESIISEVMGEPLKVKCSVDVSVETKKPQVTVGTVKEIFEGELV